jgi:alpha-D-xyloside xylohydrolase
MLNAWADGTKPWSFSDVAPAVRDVMRLRIRLLPYLYTAFARYHFDGTPPLRGMPLVEEFVTESPDAVSADGAAPSARAVTRRDAIKDQFLVGESLLVAPMFAGQSSRVVALPNGKWYDFYTGRYVGDGGTITWTPGLDRIPLFVRDGGIIPMLADDRRQVPAAREQVDLEIRHYGDTPGRMALYDDDGTTFDYERGAFSWTELAVSRDASGALRGSVRRPPPDKPFSYRATRWRMMSAH